MNITINSFGDYVVSRDSSVLGLFETKEEAQHFINCLSK